MKRMEVTAPVVHMRKKPVDAAELVSQALFGERVDRRETKNEWSEIETVDGYSGFCETKFLRAVPAGSRDEDAAFVCAREAALFAQGDGAPAMRLSYGSRIHLAGDHVTDNDPVVLLADAGGLQGTVAAADVALPASMNSSLASGEAFVAEASKFLGVPYLWGGRSAWGIDCSGLVQLVLARFRIAIDRDSKDQHLAGEAVEGEPCAGDLLFFGREHVTHVGFAMGDGTFLHASGWVRINSLEPDSPIGRPDLAAIYRGARRIASVRCSS